MQQQTLRATRCQPICQVACHVREETGATLAQASLCPHNSMRKQGPGGESLAESSRVGAAGRMRLQRPRGHLSRHSQAPLQCLPSSSNQKPCPTLKGENKAQIG
jgi:hypothetical protein